MGYRRNLGDITYEELVEAVAKSNNYSEVFKNLGYPEGYRSGGQLRWLKSKIAEFDIDKSHMTHKRNYSVRYAREINLDKIFCLDSEYKSSHRRDLVIRYHLIEYKCAECGNTGEWMGKPLTLTLDHINGNHNDNRLENLRFLCPNCDRQQDTFGSKNKHRYMSRVHNVTTPQPGVCSVCGGPTSSEKITTCIKCHNRKQWLKSKAPSKVQLVKDMLELKAFTKIGNKYGVSDNAVRKWCKHYELPCISKVLRYDSWLDKYNVRDLLEEPSI